MTFCAGLNLKFFRKLIKYFMYFRTEFALFFRFFDSWHIIKYLLTETSGKQFVLWTLDCRCFDEHRQSRIHKTYCFPPSQSISVNYSPVVCSVSSHLEGQCQSENQTYHILLLPLLYHFSEVFFFYYPLYEPKLAKKAR